MFLKLLFCGVRVLLLPFIIIYVETTPEIRARVVELTGMTVATRTPVLWAIKVNMVYTVRIYPGRIFVQDVRLDVFSEAHSQVI